MKQRRRNLSIGTVTMTALFTLGMAAAMIIGTASTFAAALAPHQPPMEPAGDFEGRPATTTWPPGGVAVPVDTDSGVPFVTLKINGQGPYRFLIDTGMSRTVIDKHLAKSLSLPPHGTVDVRQRRLLARGKVSAVRIQSVDIGGAIYRDLTAPVVDFAKELGVYRKIDGVLGIGMFADGLLMLDYPSKRLGLGPQTVPPADGRETLDYVLRTGTPRIPLSIDDHEIEAVIETGLPTAMVLANSFKNHVTLAAKLHGAKVRSRYLCDVDLQTDRLKHPLRLGKYDLQRVTLDYEPGASSVGHDVLKHFVLSLDQKSRRMRLTRTSDEPILVLPMPRFGLTMARSTGGFLVIAVDPGGPADTNGLAAGDTIRLLNRQHQFELKDEDVIKLMREEKSILLTLPVADMELLVVLRAIR